MADTKVDGLDYLFYWNNTEPLALEDITDYTKVGLVTAQSWERAIEMLDARDKDSAEGADDIVGDLSETISLDMNFPKDGNVGHDLLHSAIDNKTKGWWLTTNNSIGSYARYGRAYVQSVSEQHNDNSVATMSVGLKIQGKSTRSVINT